MSISRNEIKGITLTPDEIQKLKNGEQIFVEGMKSNQGKEFNANLQYSAVRRGIEFIFPKDQAFNQQTLGGVPLSPMQLKALNEGQLSSCRGYETKERRTVFFLCYHGQGYRRAPIYAPQSGNGRNLHTKGNLLGTAHTGGQGSVTQRAAHLS